MINWKLRFKNKTILVSLILAVIAFVYTLLDALGVIPAIGQDKVTEIALMAIDIACIVGIVTDPTTDGLSDSARALTYTEPKKD